MDAHISNDLVPQSVLVVTGVSVNANCVRYRCYHLQEQLRLSDILCDVVSILSPVINLNYDIIILHRVRYDDHAARLITRAKCLKRILVYETDDLLFDADCARYFGYQLGGASDTIESWQLNWQASHLRALTECDCCIVATEFLAGRVRAHGLDAFVVRNAYNESEYSLAAATLRHDAAAGGKVVFGYMSGSSTHNWDFAECSAALYRVMRMYPEVVLQITGPLTLPNVFAEFGHRVRHVPLVPLEYCFHIYASLDVNLAPLQIREPFCQAKSEIKFVEAGLVGVPTIASATDSYKYAITHGENGLLAVSENDWFLAMESLVGAPNEILRLGNNAERYVLDYCGPGIRRVDSLRVVREIYKNFSKDPHVVRSENGGNSKRHLVYRSDLGFPADMRPGLFPPNRKTIAFMFEFVKRGMECKGLFGFSFFLAFHIPVLWFRRILKG